MEGAKPLLGKQLEAYNACFEAWFRARTGGVANSVYKDVHSPFATFRYFCHAAFTILNERRQIVSRKLRQRPEYPPESTIQSDSPLIAKLPPPEALTNKIEELFVDGSLTKEVCGACNGEGSKECEACGGIGRIPCPDCSGSGLCTHCGGAKTLPCKLCKGEPTSQCEYCNGRGWVKDGFETRKCSRCLNGHKICEECGGRGRLECPICFGKGICTTCKGAGSNPCMTCGSRKVILCKSCGGEGEWYRFDVLERSIRTSESEFSDNLSQLPVEVISRITEEMKSSTPVYERLINAGCEPDFTGLEDLVVEFAKPAWAYFQSTYKPSQGDVFIRFSVVAIKVAEFEFVLKGKKFTGYFVGQTKELFCEQDPVRHFYSDIIEEAQEMLSEGDAAGAVATLLPTIEDAASDADAHPKYRNLVNEAIEFSRSRMERSGVNLILIIALLAPTWFSVMGHIMGGVAALFALISAPIVSRLLGPRVCFCNGKRLGMLIGGTAAAAASLISWIVPWGAAILPIGILAVGAVTVISYFLITRASSKLKQIDENLLTLCLRED